MSTTLTVPPYRAALLTNAAGAPMIRTGANGDGDTIQTDRQWYMFWRDVADQINAGSQAIDSLEGLVTFGNHADRPDGRFQHDGALYVEQDRGSVLYQNQGGIWQYIAGTMWGTLSPDERPTDLGPATDIGFTFRTSVAPARTFMWNGGQWVETTPIRYGTHAERLAAPIADLVSGMLWMETDRGNVMYQNQAGVWLYLSGEMWGTLSPDQRPTDLGLNDTGFHFIATVVPIRQFVWDSAAWVETTSSQTPWLSDIDGAGFKLRNTGDVAFGAASPVSRLTTSGPAGTPSLTATKQIVTIQAGAGGNGQILEIGATNTAPWGTWLQGAYSGNPGFSSPIILQPAGDNVGIGRAPAYVLDVAGDVNSQGGTFRVNGTPIGITTQNVATGSRVLGTTYPNSTGKAVFVTVTCTATTGGAQAFSDGLATPAQQVAYASTAGSSIALTLTFVVLPGNNYRVISQGVPGATLSSWIEWS